MINDNNHIFKALSRTPTLWGVPMVVLIFSAMIYILFVVILISFFSGDWFDLLGLVPIFFLLKGISIKDEKIFNNYFLRTKFLVDVLQGSPVDNKNMFDRLKNLKSSFKKFGAFTLSAQSRDPEKIIKTGLDNSGELDLAAHIPISTHVHKNVVMTKNGDLLAVWETDGLDFLTTSDKELLIENDAFARMLQTLTANKEGVSFYYHRVRKNQAIKVQFKSSNWLAKKVFMLYENYLSKKHFKKTKIYFTLIWKSSRVIKVDKEKSSLLEEFLEMVALVSSTINSDATKYMNTKLLSLKENEGFLQSEIVNFYHLLLTGEQRSIRVTETPFYELLGDKRYFFIGDVLEIRGNKGSKFVRQLEIKEYSSYSSCGMYDVLNMFDGTLITTHSFSLLDRKLATKRVEAIARKLRSSKDKALTQQAELEVLLDKLHGGEMSTGLSHSTFLVYANSVDQLKNKTSALIAELQKLGMIVTTADITLPTSFFAQMPGNFNYQARQAIITSQNFANFADFHGFYSGKEKDNSWGNAVALFRNSFGEAFWLNFHAETERDDFNKLAHNLANTVIIGSSESGKTFFSNVCLVFLQQFAEKESFAVQSVKKKATFVYLDKDYGAEACIKSLGGKYLKIKNGEATGFNPFFLDNTPENLEFLFSLFKYIVCLNESKFTNSHSRELANAISAVMSQPLEKRVYGVTRLKEFLMQSSTEEAIVFDLNNRLESWCYEGKYGWIFDNEIDELVFNDEFNNYGFDGSEFLDNKEVTNAIGAYLLHRIQLLLDGRRLVLFIDEFWKWLRGELFADFVFDKLKTIRKLNAFLVVATQSPSDVLSSSTAAAVLEQTETKIFLANKNALEAEYCGSVNQDSEFKETQRHFGLTFKEFDIVRNFRPSGRQMLIKKGHWSTVVNADFSFLGNYTKLLSTTKNSSELLEEMNVGTYLNPQQWVDEFINKA